MKKSNVKSGKKPAKASAKPAVKNTKPAKPAIVAEGVEKRNFILLNWDGDPLGTYTGRAPRQAALKAANRGVTDIILKEAGRRKAKVNKKGKTVYMKIHRFVGSTKTRSKTANDPEWMSDTISIPVAEKIGTYWVPMQFEGSLADHLSG